MQTRSSNYTKKSRLKQYAEADFKEMKKVYWITFVFKYF